MIKLLLTVQISYIEYSKIQTLVNATEVQFAYIEATDGKMLWIVANSAGIYKTEKFHLEMCKKHLLFEIESSRIIKHSKSARQNEIKNCQDFEKKIKKVVDKTNPDCYTKQAVAQDQSGQRDPKKQAKSEQIRATSTLKTI